MYVGNTLVRSVYIDMTIGIRANDHGDKTTVLRVSLITESLCYMT